MNISKSVGIVTTAIPIVGILIGGVTFGVNFKTDVETIKEDIANQKVINESIPDPYDDELLWLSIDNIDIPEQYDDTSISKRIQLLEIDLAELSILLEGIDIGEQFDDSVLRGRLAELEGSLEAISSMEVGKDGGIDIAPLIVRIASLEGSMETVRTDIKSMKTDIKNNERAASSNSSSSRTTVERYDDSDLRSRISAVERQVNSIPTTTSSGATVQRVENPFDDSSLRSDISALQTAVAVLQATPSSSYDDSEIRDRIDDIQWQLENMDIQVVANDTTDTAWLETLIFDIKNELTWRIDELEWATDTTTTSDDMYAEQWMVEDLQYEVMFIQEQVWELQNLVANSSTSSNNTTVNPTPTPSSPTSGRSWEGAWNEPYAIHLNHKDGSTNHTYTGDFWLDGYWNGEPVWTRWGCGVPPWDICYVYKYNYTSWVLQPSEPSDEWLANAYNDNGVWPWEGTWSGDVNFVDVIDN